MAQRSRVPKFGNWESEENVPYTAYFDKARKGRGGKMINPNEPEQYSDMPSDDAQVSRGNDDREKPVEQVAVRSAHERQRSKEENDLRQFAYSPAHQNNAGRRGSSDLTNQRQGGGRGVAPGEMPRRAVRVSGGSDHSVERSPLHRHGRGVTARDSPSWEGKSTYEGSHGTPGRTRMKPRGDETPDHGAAVPKFGEWDETNPASADGFTHIFNKVREERQIGAGKVPGTPEPPYSYNRKPVSDDSAKTCCFPWCRK
ncbi:hypothetical protein UlMin_031877 [Ulmus minor]